MSRHSRGVLFCGLSRVFVKIADSVLSFTIPLLVYQSTHSLAYSGLAYLIERLPRLLFFPLSGCLADRFGGRNSMLFTDLLRSVICLSAFFIAQFTPQKIPFLIPLLGSGLALLNAQSMVALESLISRGLEKAEVSKAISLLQVADQMSLVAGPFVATLASQFFKTHYLLLFCSLMFFSSNLIVYFSRLSDEIAEKVPLKKIHHQLLLGLQIILRNSYLRMVALFSFLMNLMIGLLLASSAGLVAGIFSQNQSAYAQVQLVSGLSALLVLFVAKAPISSRDSLLKSMTFYFSITCFASFAVAYSNNFYTFAAAYTLLVAPAGFFNVCSRTLRAQLIPAKERGVGTGFLLLLGQSAFPVAGLLLALTHDNVEALNLFRAIAVFSVILVILTLSWHFWTLKRSRPAVATNFLYLEDKI